MTARDAARRLRTVGLALAAVAAMSAATAAGTTPTDGAIVEQPPSVLSVDVGAPVAAGSIRLFDGDGTQIALPPATATSSTLSVVVPELPDGFYLAAWNAEPDGRSGAWTFTVAAAGRGTAIVDRAIDAAGGPVAAALAAIAALGSVLLAAAAVDGSPRPRRSAAIAAVTTAAALGTALAVDPAGSGNVVDALRAATGRPWAVVALGGVAAAIAALAGSFPHRSSPPTARIAAGAAGIVVLAGVARGSIEAFHLPPATVVAVLGAAVVAAVAAGREATRVALGAAAVGVAAIGAAIVFTAAPGGASVDRTVGNIRLEASVEPARRGPNELHLYAYEPGRGIARIGDTVARAWNLDENVGPLDIPLLRAGPHHFLTYRADLPLEGTWRIVMTTVGPDGDEMTVELRFEAR